MCILQTKTFKEETPCNAGFPTGVVNMGHGALQKLMGEELESIHGGAWWDTKRCS